MMYIYDKANELARALKECPEFIAFKEARDKVFADETTRGLLKTYKQLEMKAQAAYMGGQEPDAETMEQIKKMGELFQFNRDVSQYLFAEHTFYKLMGDIYKILGDAAEIDLEFLFD